MKLFILLACVGSILATGSYTIDDIRDLAYVLERSVAVLNKNISGAETLSHVIDERTIHITDFLVPSITLQNTQQEIRIATYDREIKDLEHKVDELKVLTIKATVQANGNEDKVDKLQEEFDDLPNYTSNITALDAVVVRSKAAFLGKLSSAVKNLNANRRDVDDELAYFKDFVKDRTCEYGYGTFAPDLPVDVKFKTNFKYPPEVSLTITGFKSHLDLYSYEDYDGLSMLKKFAPESVTTYGFTVSIEDKSQGMVEVKTVDCSWMACENLDLSFEHDKDKVPE